MSLEVYIVFWGYSSLWKLWCNSCQIVRLKENQIVKLEFSAASELMVELTLGYQSAPLVMPSGNGYFRQAELFLIPEEILFSWWGKPIMFIPHIYESFHPWRSHEDRDFPIIHLGDPSPLPPSKSDKTLYTGIYLPTFREGTNFIIKLLVSCVYNVGL